MKRARSAYRPHRVVLVRGGDAEKRRDLVATELLGDAPMIVADLGSSRLDARDEIVQLFRVQRLAHRRVAGQVRKQDRCLAPFSFDEIRPPFGTACAGQSCSTGLAIACGGAVAMPAARTVHDASPVYV